MSEEIRQVVRRLPAHAERSENGKNFPAGNIVKSWGCVSETYDLSVYNWKSSGFASSQT